MDEAKAKAVMLGGSVVAGGALGAWAGAKLGAAYGFKNGPLVVIAGTVLGTIAGAMLVTKRMRSHEKV